MVFVDIVLSLKWIIGGDNIEKANEKTNERQGYDDVETSSNEETTQEA